MTKVILQSVSKRFRTPIEKRGDVTVSVRLKVPVLIPAFKSPIEVGTTADTVVEDEALPSRQTDLPGLN